MFKCVLVFFFHFVFHAKSGTLNNHRNGSSDISYSSLFSLDSNDNKKNLKNVHGVE